MEAASCCRVFSTQWCRFPLRRLSAPPWPQPFCTESNGGLVTPSASKWMSRGPVMAAKKAAEGGKQEDGKYKHIVDLTETTFGLRANSVQREPELQKLWDDNQVLKSVSERNTGVSRYIQVFRSVDGDSQGLERLFGALSAHMWPGMILKSGNRITAPFLVEKQESKDDESNYDLEYEVLSHGFDDHWKFVGETSTSRRFERSNEADGAQKHTHQVVKASIDSSTSNPLPSNTPT
ncbi:Isoleucine--tRNA ligase, chloroplastic/mitochondrial [Zea mays]|uniref:Isoleucine--tRNA ligase, chloroplastic/mitochondrial n=1 Tax=Zea mays TaxID=4577 RepID=A0A3L6DJZ5_MAIZE|nr:Isoleucine--tRNA ligase, chloroplastic/mitochondrial [Zea mays]